MSKKDKQKECNYLGLGGISAFIIFIFLFLNYHFVLWVTGQKLSSVGEFGDMYGGINALFSGLAFVGVIIAIMMQSKELSLQRDELEETRKELKGQKEQLQLQNETMQKQQFENTFFQMLKLHNEHMNGDIAQNARTLNRSLGKMYGPTCPKQHQKTALAKIQTYIDDRPLFYSYLKALQNVLNFVEKSHVADKNFYVNLIKSEMNNAYLYLLYFFLMTERGKEMFLDLESEYKLLENLDRDQVFKV